MCQLSEIPGRAALRGALAGGRAVVAISVIFGLVFALVAPLGAEPPEGYRLDWSDEFNGVALDTAVWSHRAPGPRGSSENVSEAVGVKNGNLVIQTYTKDGKHYTGMISTIGKFERVYGYWEARIRFQGESGMWSAFWLQSPTVGTPKGDPATAGVEIDVAEHRTHEKSGKDHSSVVGHALHWDGYGAEHKTRGGGSPPMGLGKGFHLYAVEWSETGYTFFVDGKSTCKLRAPVSRRPEFIILSSEVRAKSWAGGIPKNGYGRQNSGKTVMEVDYVRYYKRSALSR